MLANVDHTHVTQLAVLQPVKIMEALLLFTAATCGLAAAAGCHDWGVHQGLERAKGLSLPPTALAAAELPQFAPAEHQCRNQ